MDVRHLKNCRKMTDMLLYLRHFSRRMNEVGLIFEKVNRNMIYFLTMERNRGDPRKPAWNCGLQSPLFHDPEACLGTTSTLE